MKTICVGRYLVDVPAAAIVTLSRERLDGFALETIEGMEAARDLRVPGMVGRAWVYGRSHGYLIEGGRRVDMQSVSVAAHGNIRGLSFTLSADAKDESSVKAAETLLARLRVRGENEVPAEPGVCVWRAVRTNQLNDKLIQK
jgi:hypothetical protein